jgi:hypothetical protein
VLRSGVFVRFRYAAGILASSAVTKFKYRFQYQLRQRVHLDQNRSDHGRLF